MTRSSPLRTARFARWCRLTVWSLLVAAVLIPAARDALQNLWFVHSFASAMGVASLVAMLDWLARGSRSLVSRAPAELRYYGAPAALAIGISGGVTSPALGALLLWTAARARLGGFRSALIGAAGLVAFLTAAAWLAAGNPPVWDMAFCASALAAMALAAPQIPDRALEPRARDVAPSGMSTGKLESARSLDGSGANAASGLNEADLLIVSGYLNEVRDSLGADEVILWHWDVASDELRLQISASRIGNAQANFPVEKGAPLLQRAVDEGTTLMLGGAESGTLVAAAITTNSRVYGALSAHAPLGFTTGERTTDRTTRSATHLGALLGLLGERRRAESERARTFALLDAADEFQRNLDQGALHGAICERAMEVTGAARATFVIWDAETGSGMVAAATDYQRVRPGVELSRSSLVAQACSERRRLSFDTSSSMPDTCIFGEAESSGRAVALVIVPLTQDQQAIGALVVEGTEARRLGPDAEGTLTLLATVAVPSLDASRKLRAESARASTDSLTGVANRRAFDERLTHLFASANRYGGGAALILADIDHFKKVNDTYGHDAGDEVLRHVAQSIARSVRSIDLAARYGGEEIAILLPRTGVSGAGDLAERLRKELEARPVQVKGVEIRVTVSFGVASYPESARTREALFTAADSALYEAKACGRNQVKCAREVAGGVGLVELS